MGRLILFFAIMIIGGNTFGQVTIGGDKVPEPFSILELISGNGSVGGIRMPQISGYAERLVLENKFLMNPSEAIGLTIYNRESNSIEYWDGSQWVALKGVSINASNGLTYNTINKSIELGGTLSVPTSVNTNSQSLSLTGTTANMFSVDNTTLSVDAAKHRVGIGTITPNATLEVMGDMRIATTPILTSNYASLVRNNSTGAIGLSPQLTLTTANVAAGTTATLDISTIFSSGAGLMSITSSNSCSRNMNVLFSVIVSSKDFGMSITYMNGMARDIVGVSTKLTDYKYTVKFAGVAGCADGGGSSQFDFTIDTATPGKILITNNGNINRTYTIKIDAI